MRIQSQAPLLAHSGIDKIIPLWSAKSPKIYAQIAKTVNNTDEYFYRTASEGDLPAASQVNEGRGITFEEYRTPYYKDWTPLKYAIGFAVTTEAEDTDYYGIIAKKAKKMFKSMEWAREIDAANFMNLATSSTFTGPDGQPLASASHPINGGTASNIVTSNPALSYTALETAWTQMLLQQSDQGNYLMLEGPFELIVPPALYAYALRLVGTDGIAQTFNLDITTLKGRITKVVMSPYFTSTTAWALRVIDDEEHGLAMVNRRSNVFKTQYDITKDADLFTLTSIWCRAIEDWRGFLYSSGLGS